MVNQISYLDAITEYSQKHITNVFNITIFAG